MIFRDGGGFISSVELGQVFLQNIDKLKISFRKVMRTFGWTPTESELQVQINR